MGVSAFENRRQAAPPRRSQRIERVMRPAVKDVGVPDLPRDGEIEEIIAQHVLILPQIAGKPVRDALRPIRGFHLRREGVLAIITHNMRPPQHLMTMQARDKLISVIAHALARNRHANRKNH